MKPHQFMDEAAVAKAVIAYLRATGCSKVWQEVCVLGSRIDIVARRDINAGVLAVEVKRGWTRGLLRQACMAQMVAPEVWAASDTKPSAQRVADFAKAGVGMLRVVATGADGVQVVLLPGEPRTFADYPARLERSLVDEYIDRGVAGTQNSDYVTQFRITGENLRRHVAERGRVPAIEAARAIDHHYTTPQSAAGALWTWAARGSVPGVRATMENGRRVFYPAEQT